MDWSTIGYLFAMACVVAITFIGWSVYVCLIRPGIRGYEDPNHPEEEEEI